MLDCSLTAKNLRNHSMNFSDKSQAYLAKLFIPIGEKYEQEAIHWRLKLIKQENTYPFDNLVNLLKKAIKKNHIF